VTRAHAPRQVGIEQRGILLLGTALVVRPLRQPIVPRDPCRAAPPPPPRLPGGQATPCTALCISLAILYRRCTGARDK
jgi:hypothetical protein